MKILEKLKNKMISVKEYKQVKKDTEGNIFVRCYFTAKICKILPWFNYGDSEIHSFNDEPAFISKDGVKTWFHYGKIHREGAPARIWNNGIVDWYNNNLKHREDGPARIWPNGRKEWYFEGKRHREDGPAIVLGNKEFPDTISMWWYRGEECTIDEWCKLTDKSKEEIVILKLKYGGRR